MFGKSLNIHANKSIAEADTRLVTQQGHEKPFRFIKQIQAFDIQAYPRDPIFLCVYYKKKIINPL
jgi:hypothetical protein